MTFDKSASCCFTGHRKLGKEESEEISRNLTVTVEKLILKGFRFFCAGGALGFDTLAAQCVLLLRKKYSHIKLILFLPCEKQTQGWSKKDVDIYNGILNQADKVIYTSREYSESCMLQRNRRLVDSSSICVAYFTENRSGTAYTVNYAREKALKIINLALVS